MSLKFDQTDDIIDLYTNRIDNALKLQSSEKRLTALFDIKERISERFINNDLQPNKEKAKKAKNRENIVIGLSLALFFMGPVLIAAISSTAIVASVITHIASVVTIASIFTYPIIRNSIKTSNKHMKLLKTYSILKQKCNCEIANIYKEDPDIFLKNTYVRKLINKEIKTLSGKFNKLSEKISATDNLYKSLKRKQLTKAYSNKN